MPEEVKKIIKTIILDLSRKYETPEFEPHITFLGDFECDEKMVLKKTKNLASRHQNFGLEFGEVSMSTTYFQLVFARIKSNANLMNLNLDVKHEFGAENKFYMLHTSLIYGEFPIKKERKNYERNSNFTNKIYCFEDCCYFWR